MPHIVLLDHELLHALRRASHRFLKVIIALPSFDPFYDFGHFMDFNNATQIHCVCINAPLNNTIILFGKGVKSLRLSGVWATSRCFRSWENPTPVPLYDLAPWRGITTLDMADFDAAIMVEVAIPCVQLEHLTVRFSSNPAPMWTWTSSPLPSVHTFRILPQEDMPPDQSQVNGIIRMFSLPALSRLTLPSLPDGPIDDAVEMINRVQSLEMISYNDTDLFAYVKLVPENVTIRVIYP